ncbi:MAG: hypothetical protein AUJ53_02805 [Flavobacteriaceae bacterium CG1_02_35_72]|nr:MAG: hypothetical protein AUJ53_02805 [Flavobacteriaceae bacterium CG1_02_35_72]
MQKNTIQIWARYKKQIAHELNTSLTTVQMSLDYYNNSDLAIKIRQRAKQLLLEEVEKIDKNNFDT